MKKLFVSILAIIFISSCSFIQTSPDVQDTATDLIAFNAGCVGIIEAPEVFKPAAVIAKTGLDLINDGKVNIGTVITDLQAAMDIDFDNKILQANITRMLTNIKITMSPDAGVNDIGRVKVILQSFLDGVKACGGTDGN